MTLYFGFQTGVPHSFVLQVIKGLFQLFCELKIHTQVHFSTDRQESRVLNTRVSVMVTEGITTWYQSFG